MTRHPLSCRGCGGVTSISVNSYAYYSGDCVPVTRGRFTISTGIYRSLRTRSESWLFLDVHKPACNRGNATQAQISRTCGLPLVTVKRFVKLTAKVAYVAFFALQKRRAGRKLTAEVWSGPGSGNLWKVLSLPGTRKVAVRAKARGPLKTPSSRAKSRDATLTILWGHRLA